MKMHGQQMIDPELNSVHSVKILLCYILEKLNRSVTEEQLRIISDDSGIINYFYFSDALDALVENESITAETIITKEGKEERLLSLTEKGRLGSEYFNSSIPLVFRKKLLKAAFTFFLQMEDEKMCSVEILQTDKGCTVHFTMNDGVNELMDMSFYAPDNEQAELIAEKIKANPMNAYKKILGCLLDNEPRDISVDRYL